MSYILVGLSNKSFMSIENNTLEKPTAKKRGRKPSNPERAAIVEKLKNIAKQDITDFFRTTNRDIVANLQIRTDVLIDKKTPKHISDCIKSLSYEIAPNGSAIAKIDLHDPFEAIRLLKDLGEI